MELLTWVTVCLFCSFGSDFSGRFDCHYDNFDERGEKARTN